ncbi:MAG: pilin [Candidatus Paceibacterota bacterium]|jgi:mannose/fructose/N-acetylgalactosamine-specific phosphotransferase system component IID
MKKKLIALSGFVLGLAPVAALAATVGTGPCNAGQISDIGGIMCKISQLLNAVVPVLIALAVVFFVWGVVSYVINDDEEAKSKGRDRIIYGIIGFAVIVALWGLVRILTNTFGLTGTNADSIVLPTIQ